MLCFSRTIVVSFDGLYYLFPQRNFTEVYKKLIDKQGVNNTILSDFPLFFQASGYQLRLAKLLQMYDPLFWRKGKTQSGTLMLSTSCWTFPLPLGFPLPFFSPHWLRRPRNRCPLSFCHQKLTYKTEPLVVTLGCFHRYHFLVSQGRCCPIFLWYYETLPLFLCGKKMSWSLLSGKYLNFLAPLARLNNGLPRVKSKSLITCVICSRVVSSLELFGVHLLRTWNKSERWCHSFNIRQGPSRLPFAINQ